MANLLEAAGALGDPKASAPLHTNRIFTGLWSNRSPLRDAATTIYMERNGMSRQDSILDGYNSEISTRLTLIRRPGTSAYNNNAMPPVKRFYSFNTFTATTETIRVMADTAGAVYDVTNTHPPQVIFTKSAGAGPTFFLSIGNILYMSNGVDNVQFVHPSGQIFPWGIAAPTVAPSVSIPSWAGYGQWAPNTVLQTVSTGGIQGGVFMIDPNGNVQHANTYGTTGATPPISWNGVQGGGTPDGSVMWVNEGNGQWLPSHSYGFGTIVILAVTAGDGNTYFYQNLGSGVTGATAPNWLTGLSSRTQDNGYVWVNMGRVLRYSDIGASIRVGGQPTILDSNGGVQQVLQSGKTGTTVPNFNDITSSLTSDPSGNPQGAVIWQNIGALGSCQWGYAYMNSVTGDITNMSPASVTLSISDGELVQVTGPGVAATTGGDTVIVYRTAHNGSTFLYAGQLANPGAGNQWQFDDNILDADLNTEWQAQRGGEGTPLPAGAGPIAYHVGRTFVAVGNVVWVSSGPDAVVGASSGNAGFDIFLTAQSKITRFWPCSLGMVVLTVRDAYIILGSGTDADPLYMVMFIEDLPLRSFDCFTVNKTTPYILCGNNVLFALDPSAGIMEIGFPIADILENDFDSSQSYVTYHKESSADCALYVANGAGNWYRMAAVNAPESGSAWSCKAVIANMGCVQSVEVLPGQYKLLISGTGSTNGPIRQRDRTLNNDLGNPYPVQTIFGSIVLAVPGQLAAIDFFTLESVKVGTRARLATLLGEISGTFEELRRTRQDPTNLPPSESLWSDRYAFDQNQSTSCCRHMQMSVSWDADDAPSELLTFTIFGALWQETRLN